MIRAVLLDIDNTILDFDAYVREALKNGFSVFGLGTYDEKVYDVFAGINNSLWRELEKGNLTMEALFSVRFNTIFARLGIECDGQAFEKYFSEYLNESAIPVRNAEALTEYLGKKYILAAASNGPYFQQEHRLSLAGMRGHFADLFISEKVGASKPSRAFFDHCLKKLNEITDVLPEEFIMIGDSPTSDIMGAGNAGMKTIYFDRHKKGLGGNFRADYTVHALEEIFSIL